MKGTKGDSLGCCPSARVGLVAEPFAAYFHRLVRAWAKEHLQSLENLIWHPFVSLDAPLHCLAYSAGLAAPAAVQPVELASIACRLFVSFSSPANQHLFDSLSHVLVLYSRLLKVIWRHATIDHADIPLHSIHIPHHATALFLCLSL